MLTNAATPCADSHVVEALAQQDSVGAFLDQPLLVQYVKWLSLISRGEFGVSFEFGRPVTEEPDNTLSAIIYRLRRRIERATASPVPLQALSRVGYVFRGPLRSA